MQLSPGLRSFMASTKGKAVVAGGGVGVVVLVLRQRKKPKVNTASVTQQAPAPADVPGAPAYGVGGYSSGGGGFDVSSPSYGSDAETASNVLLDRLNQLDSSLNTTNAQLQRLQLGSSGGVTPPQTTRPATPSPPAGTPRTPAFMRWWAQHPYVWRKSAAAINRIWARVQAQQHAAAVAAHTAAPQRSRSGGAVRRALGIDGTPARQATPVAQANPPTRVATTQVTNPGRMPSSTAHAPGVSIGRPGAGGIKGPATTRPHQLGHTKRTA